MSTKWSKEWDFQNSNSNWKFLKGTFWNASSILGFNALPVNFVKKPEAPGKVTSSAPCNTCLPKTFPASAKDASKSPVPSVPPTNACILANKFLPVSLNNAKFFVSACS